MSATPEIIEAVLDQPGASTPARRARSVAPSARGWWSIGLFVSVVWLVLITLSALLADLLPIADPTSDVGIGTNVAPFTHLGEPLGTDMLGRSQLSRVIYGARISLLVGPVATLIAMTVGAALGIVAGYSRKRLDEVVGVVGDALLAFPALVFLIAMAAILQPGIGAMIVGLAIVATPSFIRLARANSVRFVDREFVLAARVLGTKPSRIVTREILPNVVPAIVAYAPLIMATMIAAESAISFLGLGVPPPTPSWGVMISDGRPVLATAPAVVLVPGAAVFLTVYSLNVIGDHVRARLTSESRFL